MLSYILLHNSSALTQEARPATDWGSRVRVRCLIGDGAGEEDRWRYIGGRYFAREDGLLAKRRDTKY